MRHKVLIKHIYDQRMAGIWRKLGLLALTMLASVSNASAQSADGAQLFRQRCSACHNVDIGGQTKPGPHLAAIIGRKAGSVTGVRYSEALQKSNITWTAPLLDTFLKAPRTLVPGTTMPVAVLDPAQRAAIIAFLKKGK